jgi:hypothetical protein
VQHAKRRLRNALICVQTIERGFGFLKDPLFLASSVFVKKPTRIMALAFIIVLCLLVYRLAELRVRQRLAATQETVPDQLRRPIARPTMRWFFQCFEGIDLHHMTVPDGSRITHVLRLNALHRQVLHLLGAAYENRYLASGEGTKWTRYLACRGCPHPPPPPPPPQRPSARRAFPHLAPGLRWTAPVR